MTLTICVSANTLHVQEAAGRQWNLLNWMLGLRALGCRPIWLEGVNPGAPEHRLRRAIETLKRRLERYGLTDCLALYSTTDSPPPPATRCLDLEAATEADLLLNRRYGMPRQLLSRFRRTALLDMDPGLLQVLMADGRLTVGPHDVYFTIGETVGRPGAASPDVGLRWEHTRPCVALDWWPVSRPAPRAAFTTISHWSSGSGGKRQGFRRYLDLPRLVTPPLELALSELDASERARLRARGWRVREARTVAGTPWAYQAYVQRSLGEFSCAKPVYVRLQTAWASERTVCYLASGKPAIVQHTGPSTFLPDDEGLFRFRSLRQSVSALRTAVVDHDHHARAARALAEEHFDAKKVVARVLERALP